MLYFYELPKDFRRKIFKELFHKILYLTTVPKNSSGFFRIVHDYDHQNFYLIENVEYPETNRNYRVFKCRLDGPQINL